MSPSAPSNETLQLEIDHIKQDIDTIKEDMKEDRKFHRDTVDALRDTISVLKENVVEIKVLQQKSDERMNSSATTNRWIWGFIITLVVGVIGTIATQLINSL